MKHVAPSWLPYPKKAPARPLKPGDRVKLGGRTLWLVAIIRGATLNAKPPTAIVSRKRGYEGRPVKLSKLKRVGKHS